MTKKHFELIAKAIREQWEKQKSITGLGKETLAIHETALRIGNALTKVNPLFDIDRFLTACGVREPDTRCDECGEMIPYCEQCDIWHHDDGQHPEKVEE